MTDLQRRQAGYRAWRLLVAALLALVGAWDTLGLLVGGDAAYRSQSYDVLRVAPWGMRTYGVALAALLITTVYAYGRHSTGARGHQLLRICLSLMAGWYVAWSVAIAGAWIVHGQILAWGSVGKLLFTTTACLALARLTPTAAPSRE